MREPRNLERDNTIEVEKRPADFAHSAAAYFFSDDPALAQEFEEYLLGGAVTLSADLQKAMQEKQIADTISVVEVFGSDSVSVDADGHAQYLLTHRLNGCTASVICAEDSAGRRTAQMTHFPPLMIERQSAAITEMSPQISDAESGKRRAMLFFEGKRAAHIPDLEAHITQSADVEDVVAVPYSKDRSQADYGVYIIKVPPKSTGESVSYHGWNASGTIEL